MVKDLTKTPEAPLAHLVQDDPELMGTENIDQADLILPRLKIVQALTKEKFEANAGELINSVTGTNYGKEVDAVMIVHWKSHIMFDKALGVTCRSYDGKVSVDGDDCSKCGKFRFDSEGNKPLCNKIYNYLIGIRGAVREAIDKATLIEPLVLSFMSTGTKTAKRLNTSIQLNSGKKYPIYSQYFKLTVPTEPKVFAAGEAFLLETAPSDYVDKDEITYLQGMHSEFSKMKLDTKITEEDVKEETPDEV